MVTEELAGNDIEITDGKGAVVFQSKIAGINSTINPDVASGVNLMRIASVKYSGVRKLIRL